MIPYVGDLSRNDAELLRQLAQVSDHILEFGCGASTQIFAAYGRGTVTSIDTDPEWIARTKRNLQMIARSLPELATLPMLPRSPRSVEFYLFSEYGISLGHDLIFVDGVDELRAEFAQRAWRGLNVGGRIAFHDTRRTVPHGLSKTTDIQNVCALVERHSTEIDSVVLNMNDSNITVVTKRAPLLREDWNLVEGRTLEQIGLA